MVRIINYFETKPKKFLLFYGLLLLLLVTIIDSDYMTGNLTLSVLYIIPISFFAWFLGPFPTIIITIVSAILEILVNKSYTNNAFLILEGIMKFLLFLITTLILLKLKETIDKLNVSALKLHESLYKEKEMSSLKSSFISTVSHEFRTPLAAILAINSIIKNYSEKISKEEKLTQHNIIEEQVHNLGKMLDEFNIIGKIESDKLELSCEYINVENLFEQIIRELGMSGYNSKRIKTSCNCSDYFYCDKRLIRQIASNLLSNSLKYSFEEVIFDITSSSEKLEIKIKDYGIGIPEEDKNKIFEQFYRATNVNTEPGTGLGLSIIKKSVSLCNGTIDFTSKINEGTEFIVTIPRQVKNE